MSRLLDGVFGQVPREHREPDAAFKRRQKVAVATGVTGSLLLRKSLNQPPGSKGFYGYASAVAATWIVGGLASGGLHLGNEQRSAPSAVLGEDAILKRPVVVPIVTGAGAFGGLFAAALVARKIPVLARAVSSILAFAEQGDLLPVVATTLVNGLGEEVFFRGSLYAAVPEPHQLAVTTAAYTLITGASTKNPSLVLAAGGMGTLFGLQRRASGGIQAPILTHLTWSALVLRFLPPLFGRKSPTPA